MKDGLIHLSHGGSWYAPCGRQVISSQADAKLQSSTSVDHIERVTCPMCIGAIVTLVRAYNKASRAGLVKEWTK